MFLSLVMLVTFYYRLVVSHVANQRFVLSLKKIAAPYFVE